MVHFKNSYNQAINFLHHEYYEEAIELLEQINIKNLNHSQVRWALGLGYVMNGYPHKAIKYWTRISEEEVSNILYSKNRVEQKLPLYEKLYESYNRAIIFVKDNNFKEANAIFKELLSYKDEVPLPIDFYQGYLLSKIVIGEEKVASQEMLDFPQYVKNHSIIRNIQKKLERKQNVLLKEAPIKSNRKRKIVYGLGLVVSIMIGAIGMNLFDRSEMKMSSSNQQVIFKQEEISETGKYKEKMVELEGTVKDLKNKQELLQVDLENKKIELEEQTKVQRLLNVADVDIESLATKTGLLTYEKGIQAYKSGMYQEAASYFEQSQAVKSNEYFSDDTLFFLIQSKKKLNETDNLVELYDKFLQERGANFISSPYYDDILLEKAELLVALGKIDEGTSLLKKIQQDYPNEWTALRSIEIFKEITEENDANN